MKIEHFQVAKFAARRGKQFFHALDMIVHTSANIQQHQYLYCVMTLGNHLKVEEPCVTGGTPYRVIQIQLKLGTFASKTTQAPQCHLEVARAQFLLVVIVPEFPLFPHLDRCSIAGGRTTHPNAFGMIAPVAERRGAAGAYPFVTAGMALFLLFKALLEELHELVPAMLLDGRFFFGREVLLKFLQEPVQWNFLVCRQGGLELLVKRAERLIEAVEQCLVLD